MEDLEDVDAHKMGCSYLYENLWSRWRKGARGMLMLGDASSGGNVEREVRRLLDNVYSRVLYACVA